jgi:hypothetical protein
MKENSRDLSNLPGITTATHQILGKRLECAVHFIVVYQEWHLER